MGSLRCGSLLALLVPAAVCTAQIAPLDQSVVPIGIDSGWVENQTRERGVIYSTLVQSPGASWIRLNFDEVVLGRTPPGGQTTVVRISSILDGGTQLMNAMHVAQWHNTSAYFNGDTVRVEIIADDDAPSSRIMIDEATIGITLDGGIATICGPADDRVPSHDHRAARIVPVGCTAWLINDASGCFLTAGHCAGASLDVIQFNVPLSTTSGGLVNPPPQDQYAVDTSSVQQMSGTIGSDWAYFGCFPNSTTGLTAGEAQNAVYVLGASAPLPAGQTFRVTGYGTDSSPSTLNQVQQTHAGPYTALTGTTLNYQADTTGGNSGSAVQDETTLTAIGIHTHAGCTSTGGANRGTAIQHPALQNALANPLGVCIALATLEFNYPDGLPDMIDPAGDSIRVEIAGANGGTPQPGSGQLHYDAGEGFVAIAMSEVSPNVYDAIFPATSCETIVRFYFSAQTTKDEVVTDPSPAPTNFYDALSASGIDVAFTDNFETDTGWTATAPPGVTSGFWQRGIPIGGGDRRDPPTDADGSGQCYVTQNVDGDFDIDGGAVTLTSPLLDATPENARLEYDRWFSTSATVGDFLVVEVSDDDGTSWVNLETYTGLVNQWFHKSWSIAEIAGIEPTAQFRVRFTASDTGTATIVEGGVDGVKITSILCGPSECPADINGSGTVDVTDLLAVVAAWGGGAGPADITGDGVVDVADLLAIVAAWGPCT